MGDLRADQLDTIRRLLIDPLREAIRQELSLATERLAGTVEKLDERVADRITDHDKRIVEVEQATVQFRALRGRIIAVYGAMTLLLSVAWAMLREKVTSYINRH